MTRVIQIDGAPGVGKTTELEKRLQTHIDDGLGVNGFYWLCFTNSGRQDVEEALTGFFPDADDDAADRVKTFHGLALSLLIRNGTIQYEDVADVIISLDDPDAIDHYAEFCESHGLAFDPDVTDTRKLLSGDRLTDTPGNILFAINDFLTSTCKPPERWRDADLRTRAPGHAVERLLEAWDAYKRDHDPRLFEHGDYIAEAFEVGLTPAVEVLLIDEFQDLAPAEYRLFKLWRDTGPIDVIYIAGDPAQSIYSFRGASPIYFEETAVNDRITLKSSYRCPTPVADVATSILDAHPDTDPHGFKGRDDDGRAGWRSLDGSEALRREMIDVTDRHADSNPSAFLLTRTRHQQQQLVNDLRATGIPFELLGRRNSVWSSQLGRVLSALNTIKSGGSEILDQEAAMVAVNLPGNAEARNEITKSQVGRMVDLEVLDPFINDFDSVSELVDALQVPSWTRDILKNAVEAPAAIRPSEIRVGTIHAAKGLEAPAVYLFADATDTAARRYSRDADHAAEEHRVYYVGTTRASKELHLVRGYFGGMLAPPLKAATSAGGMPA